MTDILKDWTHPAWDELDWARIKDLQTRDLLDHRHSQAENAQLGVCFDCPEFLKHVRTSTRMRCLMSS